MTTTMNATTNGQIRKSLAEQIDRLDHILDGLSEALNESVATAVKDAVTLAVQEAIQGILAEVLDLAERLPWRARKTLAYPRLGRRAE